MFDFDINEIEFDGKFINGDLGVVDLYFIAPKKLLCDKFPEAIQSEIMIEYPISSPKAACASVMLSPTRMLEDGSMEDYDWFNIVLLHSDIEALMDLAY